MAARTWSPVIRTSSHIRRTPSAVRPPARTQSRTLMPRKTSSIANSYSQQTRSGGRTLGDRRDARRLPGDPILHEEADAVEERGEWKRHRQTARDRVDRRVPGEHDELC